jgi:hypothetical protein
MDACLLRVYDACGKKYEPKAAWAIEQKRAENGKKPEEDRKRLMF